MIVLLGPGIFALGFTRVRMPIWFALPGRAYLIGAWIVGCVVLGLALFGRYGFTSVHRVTVCRRESPDGDEFYQPVCDCAWQGVRVPVVDDQASMEQAFRDARTHSRRVARWVAM